MRRSTLAVANINKSESTAFLGSSAPKMNTATPQTNYMQAASNSRTSAINMSMFGGEAKPSFEVKKQSGATVGLGHYVNMDKA